MPFVAPGSSSTTTGTARTSGKKGGFVAPTDDYVKKVKPQQDSSVNPLGGTPQQAKAAAQKPKSKTASLGSIIGHDLLSEVKATPKVVGNVVGKTSRAVARPVIDVASGQGGKAAHDTAQLSSDATGGTANYLADSDIVNPIKENAAIISGNKKAQKSSTVAANKNLGLGDKGTNIKSGLTKGGAEAVNTATYLVGGAEAKGLKAALQTAKDAAAETAAKTTAKVVAKKAAEGAGIGAAGGGSQELANKPNASVKEVAENAAVGAAIGGSIPIVAGGLKQVFGKKPDIDVPAKPTKTSVPVKDTSTGATKGKVSSVLPKSTGADVTPTKPVRPSTAGYNDGDFRGMFNKGAKQVVKDTPSTIQKAADIHSSDPLTVVTHTLADASTNNQVKGIVKTLAPDLSKDEVDEVAPKIKATKDPQEVANLLYDAQHNHDAVANNAASLVGTPMDKSISFDHPSDIENAQRQALHVRIGQINKVIAKHEDGTAPRTDEAINALKVSKQKAQDILDGKSTHAQAYPITDLPGAVHNVQDIKPLPFVEHSEGAAAAPEPKGVLASIPEVAKGDTSRQALVNRKAAMTATRATFHENDARAAFKKLKPEDVKLLDKLETATPMGDDAADARMVRIANAHAKDPAQFIKVARIMRQDLNTALAHRQALHPETGKLSNYFQHFYNRADKDTATKLDKLNDQVAVAVKAGDPAYTKHRIIPTYAESDALGLKRKNANLFEDYLDTLHSTASENGAAALEKGLKEAHGEGSVVHRVVSTGGGDANLGNLRIPGAKGLSMTDQALADHYNYRAPAAPSGSKIVRGYDRANKAVKNTVLAGGAFHGTQSATTILGQQLVSGIRHPRQLVQNLRLVGDSFSKKLRAAHVEAMSHNEADFKDNMNSLQRQNLAGLTYTDLASKATDGKKVGFLNHVPGIKQLHSLVFDRQLPAAKQMIFDQQTAKLDLTKPADLLKARKVARAINYMIGGADSATEGLTPKQMQNFNRVVLAGDYTQGRILTTVNAVTKFGKNNPQGKIARQAVVGKAIVSAIPGMIALVATGKLDPKDPKAVSKALVNQIVNPQIPTNWRTTPTKSAPNGNQETLKLPSTYISELTKIFQPVLDPGSTFDDSRTSGIKDFASSRIAALPSIAEKVATNRDFYGNPIITKSPKQTAENLVEQFAPIPASQGAKATTGQESFPEAAVNELGLRASASTLPDDTSHARRLNEFYNVKDNINTKVRAPLIKQINTLISQNKPNQAKRLAQTYNASLPQRLSTFRAKWADGYNPAFDKSFVEDLPIKISDSAFKTRLKNSQASADLLK